VDYYDKAIERLDDDEERKMLQGKRNPTSGRMVPTMQPKSTLHKGCVLFAMHISSDKGKDVEDDDFLKKYPIL